MAITLPTRKLNRTKLNLFLDIGLALAYAVEMERHFTGAQNHELIGLGLLAAFLLHLVLHWRWIVSITKTFFHKLFHETRLNYALALLLFVNMGLTIASGILISETLGLDLNIRTLAGISVEHLHTASADLSVLLVALHVAMHWKWIGAHSKKYLFNIKFPARAKHAVVSSGTLGHSEA